MVQAPPGDLLRGCKAIGDYLGISERQALYLAESRQIPFFYVGSIISARRTKLTEWMERQEAAAGAKPEARSPKP